VAIGFDSGLGHQPIVSVSGLQPVPASTDTQAVATVATSVCVLESARMASEHPLSIEPIRAAVDDAAHGAAQPPPAVRQAS
jgi:hypothetical protein